MIQILLEVLSSNVPITHITVCAIIFNGTHTRELFLNYLCNHFRPHSKCQVSRVGPLLWLIYRAFVPSEAPTGP